MKGFYIIAALFLSFSSFAQEKQDSLLFKQENVIAFSLAKRLFGTGDQMGSAAGADYRARFKKHFAYGLTLDYAKASSSAIDNTRVPLEIKKKYQETVKNLKVAPYFQYIPFEIGASDVFVQLGPQFGLYNQVVLDGGYSYDQSSNQFTANFAENKQKGVYLGYDAAIGLNLKTKAFQATPSAYAGYDTNGNSMTGYALKIGMDLNYYR